MLVPSLYDPASRHTRRDARPQVYHGSLRRSGLRVRTLVWYFVFLGRFPKHNLVVSNVCDFLAEQASNASRCHFYVYITHLKQFPSLRLPRY